jgi:hypothetical protein
VRLKEQVIDISCNMALLMADLERNIGPFGEARGSNLEIRSEEKPGENEDPEKELRKECKKENPSSSTITP